MHLPDLVGFGLFTACTKAFGSIFYFPYHLNEIYIYFTFEQTVPLDVVTSYAPTYNHLDIHCPIMCSITYAIKAVHMSVYDSYLRPEIDGKTIMAHAQLTWIFRAIYKWYSVLQT